MRFFCFALQELLGNTQFYFKFYRRVIMSAIDLGDMRTKYKERDEPFLEEHLVSNEPFGQFTFWFDEVKKCKDIVEPNAMCIATANKEGFPSARMVLLKSYSSDGFTFFTNYESRKGTDLEENPKAALLFYWPTFNRQVRIEGTVTKTTAEESREYFERRPLGSRVSAAVSPQSQTVPSRKHLEDAAAQLLEKGEVTKPSFWGGYRLSPKRFEFWQGQSDRLHDRLVFTREREGWAISRIAP